MLCNRLGSKGQDDGLHAGYGIAGTNWTSPRLDLKNRPPSWQRAHTLPRLSLSICLKGAPRICPSSEHDARPLAATFPYHLLHREPPHYRGTAVRLWIPREGQYLQYRQLSQQESNEVGGEKGCLTTQRWLVGRILLAMPPHGSDPCCSCTVRVRVTLIHKARAR